MAAAPIAPNTVGLLPHVKVLLFSAAIIMMGRGQKKPPLHHCSNTFILLVRSAAITSSLAK